MRNVTLVIFNSLRIKCHIRRPLTHSSGHRLTSGHKLTLLSLETRCSHELELSIPVVVYMVSDHVCLLPNRILNLS